MVLLFYLLILIPKLILLLSTSTFFISVINESPSLNFLPSAEVYLEFAGLLEELGEYENAEICYKQGLNYSIHNKGKILNLKPSRGAEMEASLSVVPDSIESNHL